MSESCHTQVTKQKHAHWPELAKPGECQRCHAPVGNLHEFETASTASSCFSCHRKLEEKMKASGIPHDPAKEDCLDCHDPHGGASAALLADVKGDDLTGLCFTCHEEEIAEKEFKHKPVAKGTCTECHDPHVSKLDHLLRASGSKLCLRCHEKIADSMEASEQIHDPAEDDCIDCHDPHSGPHPKMLPAKGRALCAECHDDIVELAETSSVDHTATTTGDECVGCHSPHAADTEPMLKKPQPDLCLGCHDKRIKSGATWLIDMAEWLEKNERWHEPISKDGCTRCHSPHGGSNFRLLRKAYPRQFYVDFSADQYALCFSCHEETLATAKSTRTLTGFRNGDRNLHYLHVNRAERGRSCRACHDPHAGHSPLNVRERAPFGRWLMPITFKKTDNGGSCLPGCHSERNYDRSATTPPPLDPQAKPAAESTGGPG